MTCKWCEEEIKEGDEIDGGTKYTPAWFCSDRCMAEYDREMYAIECDRRYDEARDRKLMGEDY